MFLTVKEVAARIGVTPQTVWKWIRSGRLEAVKISSRNYRIPEAAVERFGREGANG